MTEFNMTERISLEKLLGMSTGYVLSFSDRTFHAFVYETVGVDIHSSHYTSQGTSKANKLRTFWKVEPDHVVGKLLDALIASWTLQAFARTPEEESLAHRCRTIVARLLTGAPRLAPLKEHAKELNANHLSEQIRRLEASIETDPSLAIGTAKELVETCCRTILAERGKPVTGTPDVPALTKATLKELKLVPEAISESARGAEVIKRILSNLGTVGNGLAELRNLYGTGHGKDGHTSGLGTRHAKLAVGAATTLVVFLFETHKETKR